MRRTLQLLRRAAALTSADWRVLGASVAALARTDLQLACLPYGVWRARVAAAMREIAPGAAWTPEARRRVRLFGIAVRCYPRRTTCLVRALALHATLARARIPTTLCIGVRRPGALLEAHAWLEQHGAVVYDQAGIDEPHARLSRPRPTADPRPRRRRP